MLFSLIFLESVNNWWKYKAKCFTPKARVYGSASFFERSIFLFRGSYGLHVSFPWCMNIWLSLIQLFLVCIYPTFIWVYFLFTMAPSIYFENWITTLWIDIIFSPLSVLGCCRAHILQLGSLRLNSVHIGVSTYQLSLDKHSRVILN